MKKKEMESFSLPYGYQLTLYADDNMTGESVSFIGAKNDDNNALEACVNLDDHWRNRARSYSITKQGGASVFW